MTHHVVIKLFNGYLVVSIRPYSIVLYHILSRGVALYSTCIMSVHYLSTPCPKKLCKIVFARTLSN